MSTLPLFASIDPPHRQYSTFRLSPRETLRTTPVFETYWKFAVKRQELFYRRVEGSPFPWTDDPILKNHRFTNVYRASDRVSQYLIRNVIYQGEQSEEEIFFRIVLFKLFNKIDTWEFLKENIGELSWRRFNLELYDSLLSEAFASGRTLYSAAYIIPAPLLGAARKHTNHLALLSEMMRDRAPIKVAKSRSLRDVYDLLASYPSFGRFLAYQFTIDLNYSELINFSEMDFVVAGPGAKGGITKSFADTAGFSDEDIIRAVSENAAREFDERGLSFKPLWGRPLQLIDCQNLFCEVDKYARVAHPEVVGDGRVRIKQRYIPTNRSIPQWYPPKWRLDTQQA